MLALVPGALAVYAASLGRVTPQALFFGRERTWQLLMLLWQPVRLCVLVPVGLASAGWFAALCGLEERPMRCFSGAVQNLRALWCFALTGLWRTAALLPCALLCMGGIAALRGCGGSGEDAWRLLLAVQCFSGAFWALLFYLRLCLGLAGVPVLWLHRPELPAHRCIREALRMLRGHRRELLRILLWYLPGALPLVTIPFLLPALACDVTVFLQIRMREYFQNMASQGTRADF